MRQRQSEQDMPNFCHADCPVALPPSLSHSRCNVYTQEMRVWTALFICRCRLGTEHHLELVRSRFPWCSGSACPLRTLGCPGWSSSQLLGFYGVCSVIKSTPSFHREGAPTCALKELVQKQSIQMTEVPYRSSETLETPS